MPRQIGLFQLAPADAGGRGWMPDWATSVEACMNRYGSRGEGAPTLDSLDQARNFCENLLAGRYRLQTLETGQHIYENQLFQNSVIMWMVVTITISGVVLAAI